MNINDTLFNEIDGLSTNYDLTPYKLQDFLETPEPFLERQEKAIFIIKDIMTKNKKQELFEYVTELARVERGIRELEPSHRDHVVHAMLSFILGIYINEKFLKPSDIYIDPFEWKLAGLFHDIGYSVQVASRLLRSFEKNVNRIRKLLGSCDDKISFKIIPEGFENLTNDKNSFELIQKRLDDWELKIDTKKVYAQMVEKSSNVDHGIISSLAVLNVIDLLYQKYNPKREYLDVIVNKVNFNQKFFDNGIISACSAIYIHNLPSDCFDHAKIDRSKAPLAFLLKLSDSLQEWERPAHNDKTGSLASEFDINIDNNCLILQTPIQGSKKEKIKEELLSSLICPDIKIL